MQFNLRKPCKECPYTPKVPGWLGSHDASRDFHDMSMADVPHPCHLTVNGNASPTDGMEIENAVEQMCAGQAMYMNKRCKSSRNPDVAAYQKTLRGSPHAADVFSTPEEMEAFHGR